jgi:hypothetical protein
MQGLFIDGERPKSKKAVKEAIAAGVATVRVEATSWFGNEYDGNLAYAPDGAIAFVGPDPFTKRNFYGTIVVSNGKATVK